jgi:hypothetical protein
MTAVPIDSLMHMVLAGHAHQRALSDPDVFADAVQAFDGVGQRQRSAVLSSCRR